MRENMFAETSQYQSKLDIKSEIREKNICEDMYEQKIYLREYLLFYNITSRVTFILIQRNCYLIQCIKMIQVRFEVNDKVVAIESVL